MKEVIVSVFLLSGTFFMLIASIGIIRLPDFYIRMSVVTKASTIGLGLVAAGAGIYFNTLEALIKVLAIVIFIIATSPIAAHIISKAASEIKVPFWDRTDLTDYREASETPDPPQQKKSSYGRRKT